MKHFVLRHSIHVNIYFKLKIICSIMDPTIPLQDTSCYIKGQMHIFSKFVSVPYTSTYSNTGAFIPSPSVFPLHSLDWELSYNTLLQQKRKHWFSILHSNIISALQISRWIWREFFCKGIIYNCTYLLSEYLRLCAVHTASLKCSHLWGGRQ